MKALLIYNPVSGHHKINKKISTIKDELAKTYDVLDVVQSNSKDDFVKVLEEEILNYDDYIICGGDGSINMAINVVARFPKRPRLAFLPFGTLNDAMRNLGCSTNFKKALKTIKNHKVEAVDIVCLNDEKYFSYCASLGAFSDIPVLAKNKTKRFFGRFAYYFMAIPMVFKKVKVKGTVKLDDELKEFEAPFIVILNGKKMGGFKINKESRIDDGKIEVVYGKSSLFNSLLDFFFFNKRVTKHCSSSFEISIDSSYKWNVDGEATDYQNVNVNVLHNFLEIIRS